VPDHYTQLSLFMPVCARLTRRLITRVNGFYGLDGLIKNLVPCRLLVMERVNISHLRAPAKINRGNFSRRATATPLFTDILSILSD
jgi:hypothetical protein